MSLSLSDVPLDLGQDLARAVAVPRVIFEQGVPRILGDAWEFVSRYVGSVGNAVAPVLPAIPPVQRHVVEVAAVAAGCWMALLVIIGLVGRLTARRGRADVRLSRSLR